jgi:2,3-bisphosphoglycerate-independent phosphoglycerate mutase
VRLLFIFIDGIGLGVRTPDNPFISFGTPGISGVLEGKPLVSESAGYEGPWATLLGLDATLGIPGLPQSATGQASIFTGINAAAFMGGHLNGFPDSRLRLLLAENGIFKQLKKKGFEVSFANAYRPAFFEMLQRGLPGNRYSCSTLVTYYGGLPFNGLNELKKEKSLYMDITNELLIKMGFEVPLITPEEGARRLLEISRSFDFTLFEYFLSDLAGHLADRSEAGRIIAILDRFIGQLAESIDMDDTALVITSDHGNLEDLSVRDHTLNQVPLLLIGNLALRRSISGKLRNLTDLLPALIGLAGRSSGKERKEKDDH